MRELDASYGEQDRPRDEGRTSDKGRAAPSASDLTLDPRAGRAFPRRPARCLGAPLTAATAGVAVSGGADSMAMLALAACGMSGRVIAAHRRSSACAPRPLTRRTWSPPPVRARGIAHRDPSATQGHRRRQHPGAAHATLRYALLPTGPSMRAPSLCDRPSRRRSGRNFPDARRARFGDGGTIGHP